MLLGASDLPGGGWRKLDERTWRSGLDGGEVAQRARQAGSITAWRSFVDGDEQGWLWLQVMPVASQADGISLMAELDGLFLRNLRAQVKVLSEREVPAPPISGVDQTWAYEQEAEGRNGASHALYLAFRIGTLVTVMSASGTAADWTQLAEIGGEQARRLHDVMATASGE
jgi:hypothetical protein